MSNFNVGIIGAGVIASKMADTLGRVPELNAYAIASREKTKAEDFAAKWGVDKSYGSYKALVDDPNVDLVYVATPHSFHLQHAKLAIEAGKPVLCEKAFTANAREAEELLDFAHKKGVFITEAIWTRYMPLSLKIKELIDSGTIGTPKQISASLCYNMMKKQRIFLPELGGGALLDVGVYCLHFARMYFGADIERTASSCMLTDKNMDLYNSVTLYYKDGKVANLQSSALSRCNREGVITGSDGFIVVDNINCPQAVRTYSYDYELTGEYFPPETQAGGYEYEVLASRDAIRAGKTESPFVPHQETLEVMKMMDALRAEWGVKFPGE